MYTNFIKIVEFWLKEKIEMFNRKSLIYLLVVLIIVVSGMLCANYLKDERIQADIDTKFASDYGNLIIGMLNKSIQTEEIAIHKYDVENTKYGYRLVELYPLNSYQFHTKRRIRKLGQVTL